ncbi:polysaccharide deacetylase family protein [Pseudalkalibacillus hwajinpoensis]|uniref:Polysaccharide deacetylase family protein n=1 Tax=Guptibacillus hwajinpoensis TaxID=208199 RepID=A0A4U1MML3_9BACL|nr:polysaccharide deacetylase family protein [Pseudalkalibacillus hwajinpoensis]TKD71812.1 polysaccharide deacetylase family protein [Pseudalkalibacillus hwajinpoensis]
MRNLLKWVTLATLLFVAACSTNAGSEANENGEQQTNNKKETNEVTDNQDSEETTDETSKEPKKNEEEEVVTEEAVTTEYRLNEAFWGFEPINDAPAEAVLLTIDDAPDKNAVEMAKTLKELDAPAIFFVNGHFLDTEEEKASLKEIHNMGFAIGNHTMTHSDLKTLSEEEQKEEIVKLNDLIEEIIGERPEFFRAPFGSNTDYSKSLAEEEGMLLMNWTYGYDWEKQYQEKNAIADIMVNTPLLQNGANLLMHDRDWTAAALEDIVSGLREKDFDLIKPEEIEPLQK